NLGPLEPRGHDADDRELIAIHGDLLPDDSSATAETTLPQTMAENDDRMRVRRLIIFGRDRASERRARAQHIKIIARDNRSFDLIGPLIACQTDSDGAISRQRAEYSVPVAVINVVRIRNRRPWAVARAVEHEHQLARLRHGQLPKEKGVDDA